MFDHLISTKNRIPTESEYVYEHFHLWKVGKFESIDCKPGFIVTNVIRKENNSYEFTIPGIEGQFSTNYGWSLVVANLANLEKHKKFRAIQEKIRILEEERNRLFNEVETLEG